MTEILTAGKLTTKQGLEVEANKMNLLMPFYAKYNKLNRKPSYTNRNMNELFAQSVFTDSARLAKALATGKADVLKNDPLYVNAKELEGFIHSVFSQANKRYNHERAALDRIYVRGLCEMYDWSKLPMLTYAAYDLRSCLRPRAARCRSLQLADGARRYV